MSDRKLSADLELTEKRLNESMKKNSGVPIMAPSLCSDHHNLVEKLSDALQQAVASEEPTLIWRRLTGEFVAAVGWANNRQVGVVTLVDRTQRNRRWMWTLLHDKASERGVATTGWARSPLEAALQVEVRYDFLSKAKDSASTPGR